MKYVLIFNNSEFSAVFGKPYQIEKYIDGTWYKMPFKDGTAFIEIAIMLNSGEIYEEVIDTKVLKYPLTSGEYRISKTFFVNEMSVTLAVDFILK